MTIFKPADLHDSQIAAGNYLRARQQGYGSALSFHLANALFQTACRFDELIQLAWADCQRVGEEIVALRIKGKGSVFQDVGFWEQWNRKPL